ncbi:MAG: PAS domain-containing protein [Phycisphaera sp.]|nr:PAS domain-containing protein [Phycisphaera sp.]
MNDAPTPTDARLWLGPLAIGLLAGLAIFATAGLHEAGSARERRMRMTAIASGIAASIEDAADLEPALAARLGDLADATIRFRSATETIDAKGRIPGVRSGGGVDIPAAPGWRAEAWIPPSTTRDGWHRWLPWIVGGGATLLAAGMQRRRRREILRLRREFRTLETVASDVDQSKTFARLTMPADRQLQSVVQPLNDLLAAWTGRIRDLEGERDRHELIMDSITSGVIVIETNGRIDVMNRAAREMFDIVDDDSNRPVLAELVREPDIHELVAEASSAGESRRRTFLASRSSGDQKRELSTVVAPILDHDPRGLDRSLAGAVILIEDATDLRRLEKARTEFVGNVSHELRTPLTNLLGYLSTARELDPDEVERERFLGIAEANAERLARIIEDLLVLARLESQGGRLESHPIQTRPLLQRVAQRQRVLLREDPRSIEVTCPEDLMIHGASSLIEQAVENLTTNALRYGSEKGVVRIDGRRLGESIEVRVTDDGPGISPLHIERIFERFYRVDAARSRASGGTGLGLAIVKHIMVAHGGRVRVESRLGAGSTFVLEFPSGPSRFPASGRPDA